METMPDPNLPEELRHVPYEQECRERANKTFFWNVDGIPVKEIYSADGKSSVLFGLRDEKWEQGYPSYNKFMQEGQSISEEEFKAMLKNPG